jgi:hypothetical protein
MRASMRKRVAIVFAMVVAVLGLLSVWHPAAKVTLAGAIALIVGVFFGIVRLTAIRDVMMPPKRKPGASDPPHSAR